MQEQQFRNKVIWMSFIFSVMVIFVHAYNADLFAPAGVIPADGAWRTVHTIESFISQDAVSFAVPGFFMLSAYLFFRDFTWEKLTAKWRRRFFSVAVPYIAWNLLYYLGYAVIPRLPFLRTVVGREPALLAVTELIQAVLNYRYLPVFWFLYQLIIMICLSPVIYALVKKKAVGIVYLLLLAVSVAFRFDCQHPNTDALLYYSCAAFAAVHGKRFVENTDDRRYCLAGGAAFLLTVLSAAVVRYPNTAVLGIVMIRLCAAASFWFMIDGSRLPAAGDFMNQSLFLYAVHFAVIRTVNKAAALIAPAPGGAFLPWAALAVYFAAPAVTVAVSFAAALFLERRFPPVWKLLSGGRKIRK